MDADLWFKAIPIASTAFFAAATLWLSLKQHSINNKNLRREEYKFAKSFFDDIRDCPTMHAFPRIKGYQAIAGAHTITPDIIKHLMDLPDPVESLSDYAMSKGYLKDTPALQRRRLDFASKLLSTERRRRITSFLYTCIALFFYLLAFAPAFFGTLNMLPITTAGYLSIVTFPFGFYWTMVFVREGVQLKKAIRLIKTQNEAPNNPLPEDDTSC